jgi:hypothetical protein
MKPRAGSLIGAELKEMEALVFISYSHVDKEVVGRLAKSLEKRGVNYFLDKRDIGWGAPITERVRKALDECIALVVVLSAASLKSQWVPFEIGHTMGANKMGANKKILPLLTHPSLEVPAYLSDLKQVTDVGDVIKYFQSDEWKSHALESKPIMTNDLKLLRDEIASLKRWLERYLPGRKEPEEL